MGFLYFVLLAPGLGWERDGLADDGLGSDHQEDGPLLEARRMATTIRSGKMIKTDEARCRRTAGGAVVHSGLADLARRNDQWR
ncbi:hypothetical protein GCM10008949_46540 [Deinococcus humi]|nr:hypothetical protein GCM10008949_46540 [Deinococcus humi]